MMNFENKLSSYNLLTLLRLHAARGYDEDNTTVGK